MNALMNSKSFEVSNVEPADKPLEEAPYHEALGRFLGGPVEACSKVCEKLVAHVVSHPLVATLHGGFSTHRPVVLSPDIIWLTITQGLAIHINRNAESLRHHFVSHEGKLALKVRRDDFVKGSPKNPWPDVFSEFSTKIAGHIGEAQELIVSDFSTTGPVERAASEVILLDTMQSYFFYDLHTLCGIPAITLEGTVDDWRSVASKADALSKYDLEWWTEPLRPVLQEFISAADGRINRSFWDSIYKYRGARGSGSPQVSGWVNSLFPYLCSGSGEYARNPFIDGRQSGHGPARDEFPNTTSRAPFRWIIEMPQEEIYNMDFVAGLLGVAQCHETMALRPSIGWAIQETGARTMELTPFDLEDETTPVSML